jgi:hypothetical protein
LPLRRIPRQFLSQIELSVSLIPEAPSSAPSRT